MKVRTPRDLGALVRDARTTAGMTQDSLAERVGVARLWVSQLESGKSGANIGDVMRALNILGVDLMTAPRAMASVDEVGGQSASIVSKILKESRRRYDG